MDQETKEKVLEVKNKFYSIRKNVYTCEVPSGICEVLYNIDTKNYEIYFDKTNTVVFRKSEKSADTYIRNLWKRYSIRHNVA